MKGGVGRQRGTKVREAGERVTRDSDPPLPPPHDICSKKKTPLVSVRQQSHLRYILCR